jgi:tRNA:m4X modification enzyme
VRILDFETKSENKKQTKHDVQQESIIRNIQQEKLLNSEISYLEFGAGKAKLSWAILQSLLENEVIKEKQKIGNFILIDRENFRKKDDCKIIGVCKDRGFENTVKRLQMDISHLSIKGIDSLKNEKCVCVSKHLCGEATDLTIRCIEKSIDYCDFVGIFIALCCHHKCNWNSYISKFQI